MNRIGSFRSASGQHRYFEAYEAAMRECPEPDKQFDVETRHGITRVYRYGQSDAPPIVLLPGLASTSASWAPFLSALAEHHPVYAIDTMGEPGRSVQTAPLVDIADRAQWLDDVLARLDLAGVHLMGGSSGGNYAINQAIHAPDRLASVIMLDPTTVTASFSRKAMAYGLLLAIVNQEWLWRRFLRWITGVDMRKDPLVRLICTGVREYRARAPWQRCPGEDEIRNVSVPVLALFAGRSVAHDAHAAADRLRRLLPTAQVELLLAVAHHVEKGSPDQDKITQRVLEFVRDPAAGPLRLDRDPPHTP
jgi:pimeloyl-ACP methyl ester carboxylesterase